MNKAISHRGPDDDGLFVNDRVGLGHRRLSILDLSKEGHQPMISPDTDCVIVYNGEVYNYLELQEELSRLGQTFRSKSDTEIILKAYEIWGDDCVKRFNGMWSFAIYDPGKKRVFCSRDHYGIKPFYYTELEHGIAFGSEIRQLTHFFPAVYANTDSLKAFLFASITEHKRETFYKDIFKLPGGHNLIVDLQTDTLRLERYYDLEKDKLLEDMTVNEASDAFGKSLAESVKLRLRSDVTVGTCLSGGLDSSSVATLASAMFTNPSGKKFSAITAISEEQEKDESDFARQVVADCNMNWITVKPDYDTFRNSIDEVVRAQEEPFPSASILMQYHVMKTARENKITVLLDGQGGDETLLGYERYYTAYFIGLYKEKGFITMLKSVLSSKRNNALMTPLNIVKYLVYFSSSRLRYRNYKKRARFLKNIPRFPFGMRFAEDDTWNVFGMQKKEIMEYNLPALLKYEDKNSMWHSIEARLPFLDPLTVQTALSLPVSAKINDGWTKYALRRFMNGKMPDSIVWRKNKFGFEGPDDIWIGKHDQVMREAIFNSRMVMDLSHADILKQDYAGLSNAVKWRLYSVAMWEKEFNIQMPD